MNDAERLCLFPVEEAQPLLKTESPYVKRGDLVVQVTDGEKLLLELPAQEVWDVQVLTDTRTVEVFVNGGEQYLSFYPRT